MNEFTYVLLFLVFALFPDGRFVPRWMVWLVLGDVANALLHSMMLLPDSPFHAGRYPFLESFVFFAFQICVVAAQLYRYWRVSNPLQRQQTKWIVFALGIGFPVGLGLIAPTLLFPEINPLYIVIGEIVSTVLALIIPVPFAIAILRYRLWDIDIIIRRTLVYGTLTAILAAIYFAVVIGTQTLVQALTGIREVPPVLVVASTLLIAALFTPLRRRLQSAIDRRFYRRKYDAARTLAAFGETLRGETNLSELSERLTAVVEETMQPARVSLWLRALPRARDGERVL